MSQGFAPQFHISCLEEGCQQSCTTDSCAEAREFIGNHSEHTGHELTWGSERYQVSNLVIGEFIVECSDCSDRTFSTPEAAQDYVEKHRRHTNHDVSDPGFRERSVSELDIEEIVRELTDRGEFDEGVPASVILALAQGNHRSAKSAHLSFKLAKESGDIYEASEGCYKYTDAFV